MKKISLLLICVLVAFTGLVAKKTNNKSKAAGKPVITFAVKDFDFGKIKESDGNATHVFEFTNTGNAPLVIKDAKASCGCTTPKWTKQPIAPGAKGTIEVVYAASNRVGVFNKVITVLSNDTVSNAILTIKGEVIQQ